MKRIVLIISIVYITTSFLSCSIYRTHKINEITSKMDSSVECQNKWVLQDLNNSSEIEILYFHKSLRKSISYYPNFIIGVTNNFDTIAIIDKTYPCPQNLKINNRIKVNASKWTDLEKETTSLMLYTDASHLLCSVKLVLYASVDWTSIE